MWGVYEVKVQGTTSSSPLFLFEAVAFSLLAFASFCYAFNFV